MAKLTKSDVLHISKLANLELTETEINLYLPQLNKVVDFVSQLNEVETTNTEPISQTTGLENVYRDDEVMSGQSLSQEEATKGTENTYNGYFKVKAILSERSDK